MNARIALALALPLLSCLPGCSTPAHNLQSVSVSPAAVTPAPGVTQQFTATGHWTSDPLVTSPLPVSWGVCQNDTPTTAVTVSSSGVATCGASARGTFSVFANHPTTGGVSCNVLGVCGGGCQVTGYAQLTCP